MLYSVRFAVRLAYDTPRIITLCGVAFPLLFFRSSDPETPGPVRGPDGGTHYRVSGIQVLPATGRPFSARDHIVWTQGAPDGSLVTTELYALVARDAQGRIYRERRKFVPVNSNQPSRQLEILLLDPVSHTRTACDPATRRCTVSPYQASATFVLNPDAAQNHGMTFLTRESLGQKQIDGQDVTGTRETLQIASGVIGNSQPLTSTRDFWYSPSLQVNLSVTRNDPRFGTQVLQLVDLSLTDPDASIFQLPAGFSVQTLTTKDLNAPSDATTAPNSIGPVRVSNGVMAGLILHKIPPVYPELARQSRIEGTVILSAVIGEDGHISKLEPVSGPVELIPAAITAVQQWEYRPYISSGRPVEVETQIQVNFALSH
jgi:TonB family protein